MRLIIAGTSVSRFTRAITRWRIGRSRAAAMRSTSPQISER
jgi:hypothetical protein